jgi:hypothetical protein
MIEESLPAREESYSPATSSNVWSQSEHEAQVVVEIGADIARRYANRELRPGFDANAVEIDLEELASELLTNEPALKALEPENALWRGRLNDWARRSAAHFAMAGDSPFSESLAASSGVKPFLELRMARYLVIAWTALGGELLGEFLKDIVRRGSENRDLASRRQIEALICQAVAGGATTISEILERIEPHLRVKDSSEPVATHDPLSRLVARGEADAERKLLKDRIRKIVERMRRDQGKVRGKVKAEDFGFPTSTDSSGA